MSINYYVDPVAAERLAGATPFRADALVYAEWEAVAKRVDTASGVRVVTPPRWCACQGSGRVRS